MNGWKLVPVEPDQIHQMAFEEGQPAENGDGYMFTAEEFDLFVDRLLTAAAPVLPADGEHGAVKGLRQLVIGPYPDPDVEDAHDEYLDEHQPQALWLLRNAGRIETHITRLQAENAALQQRLNVADQRVDELEDAATVASMRIRELDLTFGRYLLGMKAAVIADESGGSGMEWIFNGLAGPGELPPEDEHDAQAYFDREVEAIDAGLAEVFAFHDARRKARQVKP